MNAKIKTHRELDCLDLYCPEPVFRTRQEIDKLEFGQVLEVVANDPAAEEDIPRLVSRIGHELIKKEKKEETLRFIIKKRE